MYPVAAARGRIVSAAGNGLLNNLIAYWPLNEAAGANNALDLHTNGLTLTQTSSPGSGTGKVYAGARTFAGSFDYFSRASGTELQAGDVDFTIAAWVYLSSKTNPIQPIVSKELVGASGKREYHLYYEASTDRYRGVVWKATDSTVNLMASSHGSPSLDAWTLCVIMHNATTDVLSIQINNGTEDTTAIGGSLQAASDSVFAVGSRASNLFTEFFTGRIGPVAMWKSAAGAGGVLTAAQRTALYNAGAGLAYASFTD